MRYENIDKLGVGVNYRSEIGRDILTYVNQIDFLEVYTEKFFIKKDDEIVEKIIAQIPLVLHGLDLSIGSNAPVKQDYLQKLNQTLLDINFQWFSDHISLTEEEDIEVGHLMPVQFSEQILNNIVDKTKKIAASSDKPFLLENITYYYPVPGGTLTEQDFISRILEQADCGMLLDLNNLYINARNMHYDPYAFLHQIPLERVVEIHLAGGSFKQGMLVDTHANPIREEVWKLLDYTCKIAPIKGVIIERDANLKVFNDLLEEVNIAKSILKKNNIYSHHSRSN